MSRSLSGHEARERALMLLAEGLRLDADEAIGLACAIFAIGREEALAEGRGTKRASDARAYAMYLLRRSGWGLEEISRVMGRRHHKSVITACKKVEQSSEWQKLRLPEGGVRVRVVDDAPSAKVRVST